MITVIFQERSPERTEICRVKSLRFPQNGIGALPTGVSMDKVRE